MDIRNQTNKRAIVCYDIGGKMPHSQPQGKHEKIRLDRRDDKALCEAETLRAKFMNQQPPTDCRKGFLIYETYNPPEAA